MGESLPWFDYLSGKNNTAAGARRVKYMDVL